MKTFIEALMSEGKHSAIPKTDDYFGNLIGSWTIDYVEEDRLLAMKGEWHFAWILEGMAIQDVIILPGYEVGTSLRIYNPQTQAWDVSYGYMGRIISLEARKHEDKIVLTFQEDAKRKWVFTSIEDHHFHWVNVIQQEDETWHILAEIDGKRM